MNHNGLAVHMEEHLGLGGLGRAFVRLRRRLLGLRLLRGILLILCHSSQFLYSVSPPSGS